MVITFVCIYQFFRENSCCFVHEKIFTSFGNIVWTINWIYSGGLPTNIEVNKSDGIIFFYLRSQYLHIYCQFDSFNCHLNPTKRSYKPYSNFHIHESPPISVWIYIHRIKKHRQKLYFFLFQLLNNICWLLIPNLKPIHLFQKPCVYRTR